MDLIKYSKNGNPVLYFPDNSPSTEMFNGNRSGRLACEVFQVKEGVLVVDSGWSDPLRSTHPFHILKGVSVYLAGLSDKEDRYIWKTGSNSATSLSMEGDDQARSWGAWIKSSNRRTRAEAYEEAGFDLGPFQRIA